MQFKSNFLVTLPSHSFSAQHSGGKTPRHTCSIHPHPSRPRSPSPGDFHRYPVSIVELNHPPVNLLEISFVHGQNNDITLSDYYCRRRDKYFNSSSCDFIVVSLEKFSDKSHIQFFILLDIKIQFEKIFSLINN